MTFIFLLRDGKDCAINKLLSTLRKRFINAETVLDVEWNLLLVLDLCRYDLMENVGDGYGFSK